MREKTKNKIFVIDIAILIIALIIHFFSYYIYLKYAFNGALMKVDLFCLFAAAWSFCGLTKNIIMIDGEVWEARFMSALLVGAILTFI